MWWKQYKDTDYEVHKLGLVRNRKTGKILSEHLYDGHIRVQLYINKVKKNRPIHILGYLIIFNNYKMQRENGFSRMILSKKLIKAVEREAKAIRDNATKEEIDNLILDNFDGDEFTRCVYGLLTGDCRSPRAIELIGQCAEFTVRLNGAGLGTKGNINIIESEQIDPELICKVPERTPYNITCFSPIEIALWKSREAGENIINIIKGKRKTFKP